MATRFSLEHDKRTRDKIKVSQIVNALNNHVAGKNKMSSTQIRAAEILLNKCLPNLQSTEVHQDNIDNMPVINITLAQPDQEVAENQVDTVPLKLVNDK